MPVAAFEPKFMKIGVLTAALQELTPRDKRDRTPTSRSRSGSRSRRELGADYIQLSAALHPRSGRRARRRRCSTRWPNTSNCASPSTRTARKRVQSALKANGIGFSDLGYFDNMLVDDDAASAGRSTT